MASIYESDIFNLLPDRSMHPGGLRLTDRAVRLAGLREGQRCADLGCGTGATCAYLTDKHRLDMIGLDASEALIDVGHQKYPGLDLRCWDCRTLPFEAASLDGVLLECTLSVIGTDVLKVCARALKPSGKLILSDITLNYETTGQTDAPLSAAQLAGLLASDGFSVNICEDHTPALRTYAAALYESGGEAAGLLQCVCGAGQQIRLRDLGYHLFIATNTAPCRRF